MFGEETRLFRVAMMVKEHIGGPMPASYNPLLDRDVVTFIETAVQYEIEYEQQQAHELDILDQEVG